MSDQADQQQRIAELGFAQSAFRHYPVAMAQADHGETYSAHPRLEDGLADQPVISPAG